MGEPVIAEPEREEPIHLVLGPRVGQHLESDLCSIPGLVEAAGAGPVEEALVRRAAPDEVGHAGGERITVESIEAGPPRYGGAALDAVDESGILQARADDHLDARAEGPGRHGGGGSRGAQLAHAGIGQGAPQGEAPEALDEPAQTGGVTHRGRRASDDAAETGT